MKRQLLTVGCCRLGQEAKWELQMGLDGFILKMIYTRKSATASQSGKSLRAKSSNFVDGGRAKAWRAIVNAFMRVSVPRDTGRIRIVSAPSDGDVRLAIEADRAAPEHRQWFCFDTIGEAEQERVIVLENAGDTTYADALEDYRVCASYEPDSSDWFRVETELRDGELRIVHTPEHEAVRYAYFAPYSRARRNRMMADVRASDQVNVRQIGKSVRGRKMDLLTFGSEAEDALKLWVIAQQHPGETMAGWFVEGLVGRLLRGSSAGDLLVDLLLSRARVYVIPCMNPDGATLGNHRTNAAGTDLNRAWWEPSEEESPEVVAVRNALHEEGVDFFMDVHGDEHTPYVFIAGSEGNPHFDERLEGLEELFDDALLEASTEFQIEEGYPKDAPGKGDLRCAGNYVGEAFSCLSVTLEIPFIDNDNAPDPERGWSPERSMVLASATVEAMADVLDELR